MIALGKTYRERATGFEGMATARSEYLEDTPSIRLTARTGPSGNVVEAWFTEGRLTEIEEGPTGFGVER